ncbi:MAG TPA: serine/threonine-protein kinase, partial [Pyrinomonadaceae bacterium]|nr:serine/threonine-protein kinase [Pyrinomonadaceae bacterium]
VIHRDIKPQNLKLTPRGQIILLDFGLAKGSVTNAESLTAAKSVFGYSRNYASLEQIQGTGTDPRSDLYSLAATLYHLMTGAPPSDALTRAMSVLNGEKDPLVPAHRINPKISVGVADVLNRAMALNANHRPSSAAAMRQLLRDGVHITDADEYQTAVPIADASSTASLFTQKTAVMADGARASSSELNTSIMPVADLSRQTVTEDETSVRTNVVKGESSPNKSNVATVAPLAEMTQTPVAGNRKSRFAVGAVALIGLLVAGALASALYVFKPEMFRRSEAFNAETPRLNLADAPKTESKDGNAVVADSVNDIPPANANTPAANFPTGETPATKKESVTTAKTDEKTAIESQPAARNNSRDAKPPQPTRRETTVVQNTDENIGEDEVRTNGNRIETKDVIIDENGVVKFKNPKIKPGPGSVYNIRPIITPEQMRRMTPEQREKLRKVMELHRRAMPKSDHPQPPTAPMPRPTQE